MAAGVLRVAWAAVALCVSAGAGDVFQSLLTEANWDFENTQEFPKNPNQREGTQFAQSHQDGMARTLHITLPLHPHGGWPTAETSDKKRYYRIAFKKPLSVGTIIGGEGEVSYLKPDAAAPGNVQDEAQWAPVPTPEGQAGLRVVPFPPNVTTQAVRLTVTAELPPGGKSKTSIPGLLITQARLHNLTPEATAYASSQPTGAANAVEAGRVQNLVTGGTWNAAPQQDVSPEHPEWVVLSWPEAKTFAGVGFYNANAKRLEIEALKADETGNPAAASEGAWTHVGALTWPIWWRPAYTDAYVAFKEAATTRALRVRITQGLSNENSDIAYWNQGKKRTVRLAGVMAFTALGEAPVPPRPKVVSEPPPLKVAYAMPHDGQVTLAIDDAKGRRVRNLIACVQRQAGPQTEAWDGRDDGGKLLPPGEYTLKAITHKPLHLTYELTVNCSGNPPWWKSGSWGDQTGPGSWLADHCPPNDVTAIGDRVFIGAVVAESGHTILACDLNGTKVWGTKWLETAGAGFLTNDGKKVYSCGEGGWIGDRLMIHEIDPQTFKWRRVTQLDFDTGNSPGKGVSGIAARDGKLYVAFNAPPLPWIRSGVATQNIDAGKSSAFKMPFGGEIAGLLRTKGDVPPHGSWAAAQSADAVQHLRLAFKAPQPVGAVIANQHVEISALKADAAYPGDAAKDEQWIAFQPATAGALRVIVAPPATQTRALRFSFKNDKPDGKPWEAHLNGALVLSRRFADVSGGATFTVSCGEVRGDGNWTGMSAKPITPDNPAVLIAAWTEARTFRGLGFCNAFAKKVEISAYAGAEGEPAKAAASAWTKLGEIVPAVRWRPAYSDDYFDAGKDVTARAVRLRVLEAWTGENDDIRAMTGNKPTKVGLGALIVLQHVGDDPPSAEVSSQRISVVNIADGKWERHIPVAAPKFPHFDPQGNLVLASGKQVVRVPLDGGKPTPLIADGLDDQRGIAFDAAGNLYVADGGPEQVKVFAPDGKLLRTIATPGGRVAGAYDPTRIENPQGIAVDQKRQLWIAEADHQPKRTSLWTTEGKYLNEFIGPAAYGGGGCLDPEDKSRFYYAGMEFAIDWAAGAWKMRNILSREQPAFCGAHMDHPVYFNGLQYMVNDPASYGWGYSNCLLVGIFKKDTTVPAAAVGNADVWQPFKSDPALAKLVEGKPLASYSFAWSDQNGDGVPQADEVTIGEQGVRLNCTYWPSFVSRKLEVCLGNRILKPTGFTPCGAPIYKPFEAKSLTLPAENVYATAIDGQGRVLVNGRPVCALNAEGGVEWSYPQRWVGVHDSQQASAPKPGQLIGSLGFAGQAEGLSIGETFMLSGNKGEWYLFTADGLLAASVWHDYREPGVVGWNFPEAKRGMPLDNVTLGEEHFQSGFVRTKDGKYYVVAGHNHNSIVELSGLDTMARQQLKLMLAAQDLAAAEQWYARQAVVRAQKEVPRHISVKAPPAPIKPDGKLDEWKDAAWTPIGSRGAFAIAYDATNLYVAFQVSSGNALRNAGDDPNMLFKTGDSVDVQIGVDAKAPAGRTAPVPGDQRLLLAVFQGKPIGVLYKHRVPETPQAERTGFASPWRTEYVDKIVRLDSGVIGTLSSAKGYDVEAVVPLELLGLKPEKGARYQADFGILSADAAGGSTQVRTYWANQATGVVSDVPSEIMLVPGLWGEMKFE